MLILSRLRALVQLIANNIYSDVIQLEDTTRAELARLRLHGNFMSFLCNWQNFLSLPAYLCEICFGDRAHDDYQILSSGSLVCSSF